MFATVQTTAPALERTAQVPTHHAVRPDPDETCEGECFYCRCPETD
ncbi:hypothetical protein [Kineococcus sp. SYSU DK001]